MAEDLPHLHVSWLEDGFLLFLKLVLLFGAVKVTAAHMIASESEYVQAAGQGLAFFFPLPEAA